jgi:small subunit ribosomal protein S15
MYLTKKIKEDIFKKHGKEAKNTGSAEGQIALFTYRINHLTDHLKNNKKDFNTERSLVKLVGKRRSLLDYLMKKGYIKIPCNCKRIRFKKVISKKRLYLFFFYIFNNTIEEAN